VGHRRLRYLSVLLVFTLTGAVVLDVSLDRRARVELEAAALGARTAPANPAPFSPREGPTQPLGAPAVTEPWDDSALPGFALEPQAEPAAEPDRPREVSSSYSWYQGAGGFVQGFEEAETADKAVLVYFYTDWCPYCRQLDRDLLSRARVEETTKLYVKIKINPEAGYAERLLGDRYGVTGYPSLFLHAAGSNRPTKVRTMTKKSGDWRTSSPEEFVEMLARTAGERFAAF
jgi:thiol-disulfide isomerase/thioredoxin